MVNISDYRFLMLEIKHFRQYLEDIKSLERELYGKKGEDVEQLREALHTNREYYLDKIKENTEQIQTIEELIATISEPYLTIMQKRFFEGQKLEKIAETVFLERTSVSRYITSALKELEVKYNARFKQIN